MNGLSAGPVCEYRLHSVFSTLGVAPLLGRVFIPEEDRQKTPVSVLSYPTWKNRFNSNPCVFGTTIDLGREPYTVIGVMPRSFEFLLWAGLSCVCELRMMACRISARELRKDVPCRSWEGNVA